MERRSCRSRGAGLSTPILLLDSAPSEELSAVVGPVPPPLEAVASQAAPSAAGVSTSGVSGIQACSGVPGWALRPRSGLDCRPSFVRLGWACPALPCLPPP